MTDGSTHFDKQARLLEPSLDFPTASSFTISRFPFVSDRPFEPSYECLHFYSLSCKWYDFYNFTSFTSPSPFFSPIFEIEFA